MEIYFNELSISNLNTLDYMQIQKLKGTYKALRDFDVNTCRISAQDNL